MEAHKRN